MGAAMGWTVHEVKRTSVWEFFSAFNGFIEANSTKQGNKLSEDEKDRIWEQMRELEFPTSTSLSTQIYRLNGVSLVSAGVVTFTIDN